jgi:hypothetical protein
MIRLDERAPERGVYGLKVDFYDDDGVAMIPNWARWSLFNDAGAIVNSRSNVSLTPDETVYIVLQGEDLAIPSTDKTKVRKVVVEAEYNSANLGNDLPYKEEITFKIADILGIT